MVTIIANQLDSNYSQTQINAFYTQCKKLLVDPFVFYAFINDDENKIFTGKEALSQIMLYDSENYPYVINGFSELMAEVFGTENGIGVRSAVGMNLPQNIAVEIEALFINENKSE